MAILTSYLQKLTFDPAIHKSVIARYLRNPRLVILIISLVLLMGSMSFFSIPRVLNPTINIAIVTVATTLPGAGPDAIESLVTIPIEQSLGNVANIDTMTSTSQNSVSVVSIQFNAGVDPDKAARDVQTAVQTVNTLPKDAMTPHVQKVDFQNKPVWTFAITGHDPLSLVRFSRNLRDALKDVPTIDRVETSGLDTQEIQVLLRPDVIATYGINPVALAQTVTTAINAQPAGAITTSSSAFSLTIDPTITSVDTLRKIRIPLSNGTSVLLSDIASIALRQKPDMPTDYLATKHHTAVSSVTFNIFKKSSANITTADQDAHATVAKLTATSSFAISSVLDAGDSITTQFNDLVRDLAITFTLVFLVIFIFLGFRQAVIAAVAIPLTFLITFIVMHATGIDLSFIAFFSLLLSLGLLVDDTIVVISALSSYYRTNKFTPMEAGLLVWRDYKTAILTTTLTTVWAFVPLLLSTGIIGEFIKPIPIVVSSALLSSFAVAMFITLPLVIIVLKPHIPFRVTMLIRIAWVGVLAGMVFIISPKGVLLFPIMGLFFFNVFIYFQAKKTIYSQLKKVFSKKKQTKKTFITHRYMDQGFISFTRISEQYRRLLSLILSSTSNRRKALAMVIIFSIFSYLLVPLGFVRNEFFPASTQDFFQISLELPAGATSEATQREAIRVMDDIRTLPEVRTVTLLLGAGPDTGMGPSSGGSNIATITVVLPPISEQKISSTDIAQMVRDRYASYHQGKLSVIEQSGGPPAGADVQIKLFGNDLTVLDRYATTLQAFLKKQSGVTNIDTSIKSGTSKIVFTPDYQKMIDAGVTQDQIGLWLRTYASGFTVDTNVKLDNDTNQGQDIVLRTDTKPQTAQGLDTLMIPTATGTVPLLSLGSVTLKPNPTRITRENGKRTISVSASVLKGYSVGQKNAALEHYAGTIPLSEGYSWSTGGVNQQNQESVNSILQAMILSFLLIIITMVLQFSSFRKALIVMLVIPLSISGVFIVFAITHTPLSFPALIGILALFGIVVKNAILIVDKINQNLKAGFLFIDAIIDASESRLEPIALTSFTAIVGLIPVTLSNALWQGLGGAIIAGLLFSGSIMLFFIPVVYYYFFTTTEGRTPK